MKGVVWLTTELATGVGQVENLEEEVWAQCGGGQGVGTVHREDEGTREAIARVEAMERRVWWAVWVEGQVCSVRQRKYA